MTFSVSWASVLKKLCFVKKKSRLIWCLCVWIRFRIFFHLLASAQCYLLWNLFCRPRLFSVLGFMKVMFWIMKTKSKKSKLDCSLFIDNVYVFFSSWICVTLYSLLIFFFFGGGGGVVHSSESVCKGFKWKWRKMIKNNTKTYWKLFKTSFIIKHIQLYASYQNFIALTSIWA